MSPSLLELAVRRGVLQERIEVQRKALAQHAVPLERALAVGDAAIDGVGWLKRHPAVVMAAVTAIIVAKPRQAWRWARRGFLVWRGWRAMRGALSEVS